MFKSISKDLLLLVCIVHLTQWRWSWRRWRWRWRWWWSNRGGTFPPSSRSLSSSPHLARILLQPLSWRWTAELLLLVASHPRRWFSSSCLCRWQWLLRRCNRRKRSAGLRWSPRCWQKTTWASSPLHPHTAWNIRLNLSKKNTKEKELTQRCQRKRQLG